MSVVRCRWTLSAIVVWSGLWPAATNALSDYHADIVCPCKIETTHLTSVDVTLGVRNFEEYAGSGRLVGELRAHPLDSPGVTTTLATFELQAVADGGTLEPQSYRLPFVQPRGDGAYELSLDLWSGRAHDGLLNATPGWIRFAGLWTRSS